jgi:arylsulfatase A-like enzyme
MKIIQKSAFWAFCFFTISLSSCEEKLTENQKPNVIIIMTDDQGYGDFGFTGNPHVKTPVLDNLFQNSIRFNDFYVSPVCAPTRASLMTGRQSLRTGIRDTYNGGAIMHTDEITLAEMLNVADYRTGIFGKWHLGDNYPSRPMDQGFEETLTHLSGGMAQVGDFTTYFKFDSAYFDPVLWHNGKQEKYEGYCSDIFTSNAIDFIDKNKDDPFFCYLAFNAPHTPLQLPQKYFDMYKDIDPSAGFGDNKEVKAMSEKDKEDARKVYGMVSNIDDNIGRLLEHLDELGIADNTILIFMTDNGPQQKRYTGGMRGRKAMVYRGGIRVPMLMRYPKGIEGNRDIDITSTHMDIVPTLAELCNMNLPKDRTIDGKSLVPLLKNEKVDWQERPLFFSWTRRYPELYNNVALQKGDFRFVGMTNYDSEIQDFELYNFKNDPAEENNLISENEGLALELKAEFNKQYYDLISSDHLINQAEIRVGTKYENPVFLNRNDADGERGIWAQEEVFGQWRLDVIKGKYNVKYKFTKPVEAGKAFLEIGPLVFQKEIKGTNLEIIEMHNIELPNITADLIPFYMSEGKRIFPFYVELERVDI